MCQWIKPRSSPRFYFQIIQFCISSLLYFDQLSGAVCTQKLFKILVLQFSTLYIGIGWILANFHKKEYTILENYKKNFSKIIWRTKEFLPKPDLLCHPFSCVNLNVRIPKVGYKQTWPFLNRFQDCRATMCFIFYCGLSEWAISELHFNLLRMVLTCMFWVSGVSCIMLYLNHIL